MDIVEEQNVFLSQSRLKIAELEKALADEKAGSNKMIENFMERVKNYEAEIGVLEQKLAAITNQYHGYAKATQEIIRTSLIHRENTDG